MGYRVTGNTAWQHSYWAPVSALNSIVFTLYDYTNRSKYTSLWWWTGDKGLRSNSERETERWSWSWWILKTRWKPQRDGNSGFIMHGDERSYECGDGSASGLNLKKISRACFREDVKKKQTEELATEANPKITRHDRPKWRDRTEMCGTDGGKHD